mgnify:FL=1
MPNKFIFDVDGTLTPSRAKINPEFEKWFLEFCSRNEVYLATGSDYDKTLEQLGKDVMMAVKRSYNCSGNSVWATGIEIYKSDWRLNEDCVFWLEKVLEQSKFPLRVGNHIEHRTGTCNFSIPGRNMLTQAERQMYVEWDNDTGEREKIALMFNDLFKEKYNCVALVAGETGLDIMQVGCDKSQIAKDFAYGEVVFFGDMMEPGGNDYPLKLALEDKNNQSVQITKGFNEVMNYLGEYAY